MRFTLNNKGGLVVAFIGIYIFVVCFGNLFRLGVEENTFGVSTVLIGCIFLFRLFFIPSTLDSDRFYPVVLLIFLISIISSFFYPGPIVHPLAGTVKMILYVMVSAAVASLLISLRGIHYLYWMMAFGLGVSGLLTTLDYLNLVDIPGANSHEISSEIRGGWVAQAAGFFPRRSAMAAFISLFAPTLLVYALLQNTHWKTLVFLSAAAISLVALFFTHNRSGLIGVAGSLSLFLFFTTGVKASNKLKLMLACSIIFTLFVGSLINYFPDHAEVYGNKLGRLFSDEGISASKSDYSRIFFFIEALKSLGSSPIGHGFAMMYTEKYGFMDAHNIFSSFIWSLGVFAFFLVPYFILKIRSLSKKVEQSNPYFPYIESLKWGFVGWLINNMAHNSISMGAFWILLGLFISLITSALMQPSSENAQPSNAIKQPIFNFA